MRKAKNTPTMSPPDEGTPAATDQTTGAPASGSVESEPAKRAVAKHELLDTSGAVVETEEGANGIRYTLLANGQTFDWQFGANPTADKMLAIFGAKTLCTNVTSAERNNTKGEASPDDQIAAVRERFAGIEGGVWVDRSREGVGAKVDLDKLAEAVCQVLVGEGAKTQGDIDSGYKATIRQKLDDDKVYVRKVRTYGPVAAAYTALVGRPVASLNDLLA